MFFKTSTKKNVTINADKQLFLRSDLLTNRRISNNTQK